MTTKNELIKRTAQMLGRVRVGQPIDTNVNKRITDAYSEVYEDLKDDQIVVWAKEKDIPDKFTPHVAILMAVNCADAGLPVSGERFGRLAAKFVDAKNNIRRLSTPKYESMDHAEDF